MLIALVGVTGAGKSFFKNRIVQELGFKNLPIVTTRPKRQGEIAGIDKEFVTDEEFEKMKQEGITQVNFEFLGNHYGYRTEHLQALENQVTEVYYPTIYELKKWVPNLFSIYILPQDINQAKLELQKRNLPEEIFQKRWQEMKEHIQEYNQNLDLQKQFDQLLINDYTRKSYEKIMEIVQNKGNVNERN